MDLRMGHGLDEGTYGCHLAYTIKLSRHHYCNNVLLLAKAAFIPPSHSCLLATMDVWRGTT